MDQNMVTSKYEKLKQIFAECMQKLGVIEKKQRAVVNDLQKKTDNSKISKIKSEIEGL